MRVGALAPLVLAALLLAGCSTTPHPDPSESQMKASAAHDELAGLLAQVQKVVGGDWQDLDTGAESCTLAGGGTGARYPFGRIGPGVPDDGRSAIVEQLSRLWTAAGMRPTVSRLPAVGGVSVTQVRYPATGYTDDGLYIAAAISGNATTLEGRSRCGTGDAAELNEQAG